MNDIEALIVTFPCGSGLTPAEWLEAAWAGCFRHYESVFVENRPQTRHNGPDIGRDIRGAAGERAVAKVTNIYWHGKGRIFGPDIGLRGQVRHTEDGRGSLILHHEDDDEAPFFLVTGGPLKYTVHGWLFGKEGKLPKYWRKDAPTPAFFVPQSALRKEW